MSSDDPRGGVELELRAGGLAGAPRVEIRLCRDEPIALFWYAHAGVEAVRAVARPKADGDRLRRVRNYCFTPDVITEVCGELNVPCRVNGYRYW